MKQEPHQSQVSYSVEMQIKSNNLDTKSAKSQQILRNQQLFQSERISSCSSSDDLDKTVVMNMEEDPEYNESQSFATGLFNNDESPINHQFSNQSRFLLLGPQQTGTTNASPPSHLQLEEYKNDKSPTSGQQVAFGQQQHHRPSNTSAQNIIAALQSSKTMSNKYLLQHVGTGGTVKNNDDGVSSLKSAIKNKQRSKNDYSDSVQFADHNNMDYLKPVSIVGGSSIDSKFNQNILLGVNNNSSIFQKMSTATTKNLNARLKEARKGIQSTIMSESTAGQLKQKMSQGSNMAGNGPALQSQSSSVSKTSKPQPSILKQSPSKEELKINTYNPFKEQIECTSFSMTLGKGYNRQLSSFTAENQRRETKKNIIVSSNPNDGCDQEQIISLIGLSRPGTHTAKQIQSLLVSQTSRVSTSKVDAKQVSFSNAAVEEEAKDDHDTTFQSDSSFKSEEPPAKITKKSSHSKSKKADSYKEDPKVIEEAKQIEIIKAQNTISSSTSPSIPLRQVITEKHKSSEFPRSGDVTPTFKKAAEHHIKPHYLYENMDYCQKALINGIRARKFHYSKKSSEECIVMIDHDKKTLYWQYTGHERNKKSSCSLKDLKAVIYGALSGTFFQYRDEILQNMCKKNVQYAPVPDLDATLDHLPQNKNQNQEQLLNKTKDILRKLRTHGEIQLPDIPKIEEDDQPFYAWQCISLYLPHKTLDLAIENEEQLFTLLSFAQNTIIDNLNVQRLKEFIAKNNRISLKSILRGQPSQLSPAKMALFGKLQPQNQVFIALKPESMKTFRLMKIKMKIAHAALSHGQPILDFFLNAILKAFVDHGIPPEQKNLLDDNHYFRWRRAFAGESAVFKIEARSIKSKHKLKNKQPSGLVFDGTCSSSSEENDSLSELMEDDLEEQDPGTISQVEPSPAKLSCGSQKSSIKVIKPIPIIQEPNNDMTDEIDSLVSESIEDLDDEAMVAKSRENPHLLNVSPKQRLTLQMNCPELREFNSQTFSKIPDEVNIPDLKVEQAVEIIEESISEQAPWEKHQEFQEILEDTVVEGQNNVEATWLQKARAGSFQNKGILYKGPPLSKHQQYHLSDSDNENQETLVVYPCLAAVVLCQDSIQTEPASLIILKQTPNAPQSSINQPIAFHPRSNSQPQLVLPSGHTSSKNQMNDPSNSNSAPGNGTNLRSYVINNESNFTNVVAQQEIVEDKKMLENRLDSNYFQIQSELLRPTGRELEENNEVQADISEENRFLMLEEDQEINLPAKGLEFQTGSRMPTFFRRAKTQHSPDYFGTVAEAWAAAAQTGGPSDCDHPHNQTVAIPHNSTAIPQQQETIERMETESDRRKRQIELMRLEQVFKILARASIDCLEDFDKSVQAKSPSFHFYQTKLVLTKFFRIGDFKESLTKQALDYLRSVRHRIQRSKEPKAHILRKNLVILGRQERDKHQKTIEDEIRRQILQSNDEQEHLQKIIEARKKAQVLLSPPEKKGMSDWIRSACIKCLPSRHENNSPSPKKQNNNNSGSKKTSPTKGNICITPILTDPPIPTQTSGKGGGADTELRTINELIGLNHKKITSLFQAVRLVTKYQEMNDEKLERLRLKQTMQLKAKGFFLDNADELCKTEVREREERKSKFKQFKTKKTQFLSMLLKGQDSADKKSSNVAEELLAMSHVYSLEVHEDRTKLTQIRNKKLKALQNVLFKNAHSEFEHFQEEYQDIRRPVRKLQMLQDRMNREEMYFNPILSRLGQLHLVRKLITKKTKKSTMVQRSASDISGVMNQSNNLLKSGTSPMTDKKLSEM